MSRVLLEHDEVWPVWYARLPRQERPHERYVEVPETQLAYWDMVEREWERVQRQMATVRCAADEHRLTPARHVCLTCNPPEAVEP